MCRSSINYLVILIPTCQHLIGRASRTTGAIWHTFLSDTQMFLRILRVNAEYLEPVIGMRILVDMYGQCRDRFQQLLCSLPGEFSISYIHIGGVELHIHCTCIVVGAACILLQCASAGLLPLAHNAKHSHS